jgi:acetyl-CoA acetyltransferase
VAGPGAEHRDRTPARRGLAALCIGVGQGLAVVLKGL